MEADSGKIMTAARVRPLSGSAGRIFPRADMHHHDDSPPRSLTRRDAPSRRAQL